MRSLKPAQDVRKPPRHFAAMFAAAVAIGAAGCDEPVAPLEEVECIPEAHTVSADLAVYGCADQVELIRAGGVHAAQDVPAVAELTASGRRLKNCRWSSFTDTAKSMAVACPAETHVVSGGCFSQATMVNSSPFENDDIEDLPEHAERYQDAGHGSGWLCTYDGPTQTAGQKAAALCCD